MDLWPYRADREIMPQCWDRRYLLRLYFPGHGQLDHQSGISSQSRSSDFAEFPNVKRWMDEIGKRPSRRKAMSMGPEFREDPATIAPEGGSRRVPAASCVGRQSH
jgi:hypothetical protein